MVIVNTRSSVDPFLTFSTRRDLREKVWKKFKRERRHILADGNTIERADAYRLFRGRDPDVKALLRIAVVYDIPIATNRATADFMLSSPLMEQPYTPHFVEP